MCATKASKRVDISTAIRERADSVMFSTYGRFGPVLTEGRGMRLKDVSGKEYLDFVAGIAVCSLGHSHPELGRVMAAQAKTLWHVSNLYHTLPQVELAELLTGKDSFADRVFFANSGAEANEAAIKLVRKWSLDSGNPNRYEIVCMENSFHGRTLGTVSATGQEKVRKGFGPLLPGFKFVPFGNLPALRKAITAKTCAVMLEPVQGNGGVQLPPEGYMVGVRALCDEKGLAMVLDEVQVGMGRTGRLFCHEHYGVKPDVMTLAKALGNGLPIGAMLATEDMAKAFTPGTHASTFGGTPLVCSVAKRAFEIIASEKNLAHVRKMGEYLLGKLQGLVAANPKKCAAARGLGLICGLELTGPHSRKLMELALDEGLLIDVATDRVIRLVPPFVIRKADIDALENGLSKALKRLPS